MTTRAKHVHRMLLYILKLYVFGHSLCHVSCMLYLSRLIHIPRWTGTVVHGIWFSYWYSIVAVFPCSPLKNNKHVELCYILWKTNSYVLLIFWKVLKDSILWWGTLTCGDGSLSGVCLCVRVHVCVNMSVFVWRLHCTDACVWYSIFGSALAHNCSLLCFILFIVVWILKHVAC